jgi:hypothetical protein
MNVAPLLMCKRCEAPKLHIFIETQPRRSRRGEIPYADCIYECYECRVSRAWGNRPREVTLRGRRLSGTAVAHVVERHALRWVRCPGCGGSGIDCSRCGGEGEAWAYDSLKACGPSCVLEDIEDAEGE